MKPPKVKIAVTLDAELVDQVRARMDDGRAPSVFRAVRREVIRRGWHHSPLVGGPIRWIGKRLP
jgi:hypothetical protein